MKLELRNLVGGYTSDRDILQGVNLEIAAGEAVGLIGLNGSGKSTLAKAVMNTLPNRRGAVFFNGEDVTQKTTTELCAAGMTLFLQGGRVFDELSVLENLKFAAKSKNFDEIIDFLAWPNYILAKRADRLSGGERHRLALAMCLLREPQLLILDEPSAGLAPQAVDEMYQTLHSIRQKKSVTLLLIEQNIARSVDFCGSVNLLRNGVIMRSWKDRNMSEIERVVFS